MSPSNFEERISRLEEDARESEISALKTEIERLQADVKQIKEKMVNRDEFYPIQRVVWAAIGFITTAVLGTIYNFITGKGVGH